MDCSFSKDVVLIIALFYKKYLDDFQKIFIK